MYLKMERGSKSAVAQDMGQAFKADVAYIVKDVRREMRRGANRSRKNTVFYWAVRGGNVDVVQKTLDALRKGDYQQELSFLLFPQEVSCPIFPVEARFLLYPAARRFHLRVTRLVKNVLLLLLLLLLFLVAFTPLFPIFHGFVAVMVTDGRKKVESSLPLFLACLCEGEEMLKLFKLQGAGLDQTDSDGGNIFHILVKYSTEDIIKAQEAFERIVHVYGAQCQDACLKQTDENGLTALESCVGHGSPQFLDAIFNMTGQTLASISPSSFSVLHQSKPGDHETVQRSGHLSVSERPRYSRVSYDVTDYENGEVVVAYHVGQPEPGQSGCR